MAQTPPSNSVATHLGEQLVLPKSLDESFPDMRQNYQDTVVKPAEAAREAAEQAKAQHVEYLRSHPIEYAQSLLDGAQFNCLYNLWMGESGWNPWAVNPSSGAYGIPQSLGHGHVYDLGDGIAQVDWGLAYIYQSYGSPCGAWSFWLSRYPHWY